MQRICQRHRLHRPRSAVSHVHPLPFVGEVAALVDIAAFTILLLARGKNGANKLFDKLPMTDLRALPQHCSSRRLEFAVDIFDCLGIRAALLRLHVCNATDHQE